ncbi:MarR family winged helix-turn-helix transcriptional regulator [Gilvimarinus sp. F26214L]|uniref:MarR family winged helix-turn-helix transcriptional regulator n=1 Tax=Gilvimarinus sp. DZF01 TaxID=3461371 RepID=UPI0040463597
MAVAAKRKKEGEKPSASHVDMSVLESKLGYQVRIADRVMSKDFFQSVGMTPVQFSVFSLVATNENLSQVAVGEALNMDRASTMAIVHKLELAGLLERRKSPYDKRMHALQLTPKGKKEFTRVNKRVTALDKEFKKRLSATEIKALMQCIKKLRG